MKRSTGWAYVMPDPIRFLRKWETKIDYIRNIGIKEATVCHNSRLFKKQDSENISQVSEKA